MISEAMAYDGNNNVVSVTETYSLTGGSTEVRTDTKTYDDFDRLFNRTDSFNKTIRYSYDLNGNRTSLTDSDGLITSYSFDGLNRVTDVTTQKFISAGQSLTTLQGVTRYEYDRSSLLKKTSYPNNTTASYDYDQAKRTVRIHNQQNNATVSNYEYVFDENGNRIEQRETNGGAQELTTYGYDLNDRLLEVSYDVQGCTSVPDAGCVGGTPDKTTTYTYDAAYNRTSEVDSNNGSISKNKTYRYNPRNQLTNVDDNLDNTNSVSYAFDQNGNQIQKTKTGETTNFVFDIRDDLREVKIGGSTVGQFLYDYQGLRIEKLGERGAERSTYDDQSILQQYEVAGCTEVGDANCASGVTGQTRAKFDYGVGTLLSLNTLNEAPQFYLYDALNSVANLTNSEGAVQARYQYDAWGIKRNEVGSSYNRFAFTGYEEDKETGLLYAKARFYDPDTGKFLSEDAWEGDNMIAPSLHRYLYAYQNPTVYVDPDGNEAVISQGEFAQFRDSYLNERAFLDPGEGFEILAQQNGFDMPRVASSTARGDLVYRSSISAGDVQKLMGRFIAASRGDLTAPSSFVIAEKGDSHETIFKRANDYVGETGFLTEESLREAAYSKRLGIGDTILDMSAELRNSLSGAVAQDYELGIGLNKFQDAFSESRQKSGTFARTASIFSQGAADVAGALESSALLMHPRAKRVPEPYRNKNLLEAGTLALGGLKGFKYLPRGGRKKRFKILM